MDGYKALRWRLQRRWEKRYLTRLLTKHKGNVFHASIEADIDGRHFRYLMERTGLSLDDFRQKEGKV
jgi:hypothetical protein